MLQVRGEPDLRCGEDAAASMTASGPSEGAGGDHGNRGNTRPLSEYVSFETDGGLALLYEPSPLDRWIDRKIYHDWRARKYLDRMTGDELT